MRKPVVLLAALLILGVCFVQPTQAQDNPANQDLLKLVNNISSRTKKYGAEKLYVQTDRPTYNTGDTIWFKTYLFNAPFLQPSSHSGLLYLEIIGPENDLIHRILVPIQNGVGNGYLTLQEAAFPAGTYTLRAYTNWMRNFDPKGIFQKRITVNDYRRENWLIQAQFNTPAADPDRLQAALSFKPQDKQSLSFRDVEIALTDGRKTWHKNTFKTDVYGNITFHFKIPAAADKSTLSLLINPSPASSTPAQMTLPVRINRKSKIDLQFLPEGGQCIAGIRNRIAFKAIGENGLGQQVSGLLYNGKHQIVDSFQSSHLGMGYFDLLPQKNEQYTADIRLSDTTFLSFPLPAVQDSGLVLHLENPLDADSIEVSVHGTPDVQAAGRIFYLVAQSRGIGCLGAKLTLHEGKETLHISKSLFPSGIARFAIYNAKMQPLSQRMVFIHNPKDHLQADITGRMQYTTRDKATLNIKISDQTGRPARGHFSVAVTDDNKVHIDSLSRNSLVADLWLCSDLQGYVEDPGYYFPTHMTAEIWRDLDNLLLTQGWVSYSRDTSSTPQYQAEAFFSINGKVTNVLNKPVAGSQVLLLSRKPFLIMDTITNAEGDFHFRPLYPIDTASYLLQARNKRGKSFNVGITVNAFKPPSIPPLDHRPMPWYVNLDTAHMHIIKDQIADQEAIGKLLGKHVLKEVVIIGQKAIGGSKNLNGPGGSDFALNQSDMEQAGKATLGDVLRQKVKGFRLGGKQLNLYLINTELVHLIIDGVNLDFFKPDDVSYKDFYRSYLDYITAEDIKGIEVMLSSKYTGPYFQKFLDPLADPFGNVFIEVTTYSGNGAFLKKTPGVFIYRPPFAFQAPARFYVPKYTVKQRNSSPDVRSTIYWEPEVITNEKGEAQITFYTADRAGTYTLLIEGTDLKGKIGSSVKKIRVK